MHFSATSSSNVFRRTNFKTFVYIPSQPSNSNSAVTSTSHLSIGSTLCVAELSIYRNLGRLLPKQGELKDDENVVLSDSQTRCMPRARLRSTTSKSAVVQEKNSALVDTVEEATRSLPIHFQLLVGGMRLHPKPSTRTKGTIHWN